MGKTFNFDPNEKNEGLFFAVFLIKRIISGILFGWLFFLPLRIIFPKKKNLVIFLGREGGKFIDNTKYLYLYFCNNPNRFEFYWLTKYKNVKEELVKKNLPVLLYPSLKAILKALRANILILDADIPGSTLFPYFFFKTKKIQLGHGVGFKKLKNVFSSKIMTYYFYFLAVPWRYDAFITTSELFKRYYGTIYLSKKVYTIGYPRNDILLDPSRINELALINTDKSLINKINKLKRNNYKIILYAPTFRDAGDRYFLQSINFSELNRFLKENRIYLVLKLHPIFLKQINLKDYSNILNYDNVKDVYPLLPKVDLLVTDYSSIASDYLLLKRPVVFYVPDLEEYRKEKIAFDVERFTPGPKCFNQEQLQKEIKNCLVNNKKYKKKIEEFLDFAFKYRDSDSSKRIFELIKDKFS